MQSCCGKREKVKLWKFVHGTNVLAYTKSEALLILRNSKLENFWASESDSGYWDVQFDDELCVSDVSAKSVLEAVTQSKRIINLDKISKTLEERIWKFTYGTHVSATTLIEALKRIESCIDSNNFWASETHEGHWDIQLSETVFHYDVESENVSEAVKKARWYAKLDGSMKTII